MSIFPVRGFWYIFLELILYSSSLPARSAVCLLPMSSSHWFELLDTLQCIAQKQFKDPKYTTVECENSWTTVKYFDQHEKVSVGLQLDRSDWAFAFETFRWKMFFLYFGRVGQHLSGWLGESKVIFEDIINWFNCRVLACTSLTLATLKLNTSDTSLFLATLVPAQASAAYYRNCKWPYRLKIQ